MEDNKLVSMANQMTTFFRAYPEAEAAAALREHITLFWTPRMRQMLDARIQADTSGVEPLVCARAFFACARVGRRRSNQQARFRACDFR